MPKVDLDTVSKADIPSLPASGSFWTPQNIITIINGIKSLIGEYRALQGFIGQSNVPITGGKVPVDNKLKVAVSMTLDSLKKQGYGNLPIGQVIANIPFTVNQVREAIDNPALFLQMLQGVKK